MPAFNGFGYDRQRERNPTGETKHIDRIEQLKRMPTQRPINLEFGK